MISRTPTSILFAALLLGATALPSCSLIQPPISLSMSQQDMSPKSAPKDFKTILLTIGNPSNGIARGVTVRDTLPTGFSYVSTRTLGGDAIRTRTQDPPINSPVPTWGSWSIPQGTAAKPSVLTLEFVVAVGSSPGKNPNFAEVASDDADPAAASPLVLSVIPTALVEIQVSAHSPVAPGSTVRYVLLVRNGGTAGARSTFISAALPSGFTYAGTAQISGNSFREGATDPLPSSLLPSWGTWAVPPRQPGGSPGQLSIAFDARVVPDEAPGNYPISVTITYNNLAAQTVSDQALVAVVKK
ncbi:MAG TPA: hypothetical protein VIN56_02750 [Candidatus Dormibacteraeota bacterium]|jgi:uncharacterized repeat protein (TIGR01451 family)